eukprot:GHVP01031490.1.p1 GENE.GHVP01031490.1~~GHVP01031490.1.p1  ORF type:complete len:288 (-),score=55.95 GHVP01031490.1:265-1128(-)
MFLVPCVITCSVGSIAIFKTIGNLIIKKERVQPKENLLFPVMCGVMSGLLAKKAIGMIDIKKDVDMKIPERRPGMNQPKQRALFIDLERVLIKHVFDDEKHRWRILVRPGAWIFLFYACQYYDVIVCSELYREYGDALLSQLDILGCVAYSYFKKKGDIFARNCNKSFQKYTDDILEIGTIEKNATNNTFLISPWNGDINDTELERLVDFIEESHEENIVSFIQKNGQTLKEYEKLKKEEYKPTFSIKNYLSDSSLNQKDRYMNDMAIRLHERRCRYSSIMNDISRM